MIITLRYSETSYKGSRPAWFGFLYYIKLVSATIPCKGGASLFFAGEKLGRKYADREKAITGCGTVIKFMRPRSIRSSKSKALT